MLFKKLMLIFLCCLSFSTFAQVNTDKAPPAPMPPGGYPFLVERDGKMTVAEYKERIFCTVAFRLQGKNLTA